MKLRRLTAASATAAALFGVTAAAFPAAAQAAPLPLPALTSKALTGTALTARYQANDQAIGRDARAAKPAAGPASDCLTLASPTCYTPLQFRTAYGIQPLTDRGITGKGETVVLPEEEAWRGEPLAQRHPAGSRQIRQPVRPARR